MNVLRLTYDGDPPASALVRRRLALDGDYLYLTATQAQEEARRDLAPPRQGDALRFDRVVRQLLGRPVLSRYEQRVCLARGVRAAVQDPFVRDAVLADAAPWVEALAELEQRGDDVRVADLVNPSLGPILAALQRGYGDARRAAGAPSFEEAARAFLTNEFVPPATVVLEGFTYLLPLQRLLVRRCLAAGSRVIFLHPYDRAQPDAFAALDRTYARVPRQHHTTPFGAAGVRLRWLQRSLFAAEPGPAPHSDGSVRVSVHRHRHQEVRACLESVVNYLRYGVAPGRIAIVARNAGEFLSIFQEEARRRGMQDLLRVEPRALLLTPLGRFVLALYDAHAGGTLELTPEAFETMLASGWLGADAQRTAGSFAAARAQRFERCRTPDEWRDALARLAAVPDAPELARAPAGIARTAVGLWQRALGQIEALAGHLFDGRPRSVAEHVRRLRDELARLNPDDLRRDERELFERILAALDEVVGSSSLEVTGEEFGELTAGLAREYRRPPEEDGPPPGTVWLTTPEAIDSSPRDVVFYLGVDSARVPRPAAIPWPFFALTADEDVERERYLFLAVVRAARVRLHLSYAAQGEDEAYRPSPYLALLGPLPVPEAAEPAASPGWPQRPALPGRLEAAELADVAIHRLCPHRWRLERLDDAARTYRERFQLTFLAQGVWLERIFATMADGMAYRDPEALRQALYAAGRQTRPEVRGQFLGLRKVDWEAIRRALKAQLDRLIDGWLNRPGKNGVVRLDYGVRFEPAPPGLQYVVEVGGRVVPVAAGLRHVLRIGRIPRALPHALTHQVWLLPAYREDDGTALRDAVGWWRGGLRALLDREKYPEGYRRYQLEIAEEVERMQEGRFPKRPGDHCELCPARHTCLGVPEP